MEVELPQTGGSRPKKYSLVVRKTLRGRQKQNRCAEERLEVGGGGLTERSWVRFAEEHQIRFRKHSDAY